MGFRAWVGLWMAFFLILVVCFDVSAFVKYITRFTGKYKCKFKEKIIKILIYRGELCSFDCFYFYPRVYSTIDKNKTNK